jgi:hypothetical protein
MAFRNKGISKEPVTKAPARRTPTCRSRTANNDKQFQKRKITLIKKIPEKSLGKLEDDVNDKAEDRVPVNDLFERLIEKTAMFIRIEGTHVPLSGSMFAPTTDADGDVLIARKDVAILINGNISEPQVLIPLQSDLRAVARQLKKIADWVEETPDRLLHMVDDPEVYMSRPVQTG